MPNSKKRFFNISIWIGICVISIFFSCKNEDCVSSFNNYLLVGFIETDTLGDGQLVFNEKDTIFRAVIAEGNEFIFYDKDTVVSTLTLPVNPAADFTKFELYMYDSIVIDTISFDPVVIDTTYYENPVPHIIDVSYERRQRIITEDCGVEIAYVGLEVQEITFPFTNVVSDRLSRFNEVNIEVFF